MALDSVLGKKYKLEKSEKFDEYMKALGIVIIIFISFQLFLTVFFYFF